MAAISLVSNSMGDSSVALRFSSFASAERAAIRLVRDCMASNWAHRFRRVVGSVGGFSPDLANSRYLDGSPSRKNVNRSRSQSTMYGARALSAMVMEWFFTSVAHFTLT
jgi:hypothetical protein